MSDPSIDAFPSPTSEDNPDLWPMFDLEMEKGHRPNVTHHTTKPSRNALPCDDSHIRYQEMILDLIAEHTIGFELSAFPAIIANWIPRLAKSPLQGSYQHLLLLMFADGLYCSRMHRAMATPDSIPDFVSTHRETILQADRARNVDRPLDENTEPKKSARLAPHPEYTAESCKIDELSLERDLATLRELVGPLRDPRQRVFWITSRTKMAKDMLRHWEASMERIKDFKKELVSCQYNRKTNWTIYDTARPRTEEREDSMSMHQSRIDACKASTVWGEYLPDESQLWVLNTTVCGSHTKRFRRQRSYSENALPIITLPKLKISKNLGHDLDSAETMRTEKGGILNLIVQIAEWLALARGFPAVHLFIDMVRLFTSYGVDVANATQVEFCRFIPRMRFPPFADHVPKNRPDYLFTASAWEKACVCNLQYFSDLKNHNQDLLGMLFKRNTLLSIDNESISWEYPLQKLKLAECSAEALDLETPCPRCRFGPCSVLYDAWETDWLQHPGPVDDDAKNGGDNSDSSGDVGRKSPIKGGCEGKMCKFPENNIEGVHEVGEAADDDGKR